MSRYPIFVISKGRSDSRLTIKALDAMKAEYRVVVEPQEYHLYAAHIPAERIITTPFSNLGQGSIPVRNFVWELSMQEGHARHWVLDDNIRCFLRLHKNKRHYLDTSVCFSAVEDFVDRYTNVALAGLQYSFFATDRGQHNPFVLNTRIYSCILIDNSIPFRWRGKYNEDTDLSLRALKAGYCTVLFYAFLAEKKTTLTMRGGNTDELYKHTNERLEFAQSLQQQHPDVVKIVRRYNRWHHEVDYRPFAGNKLMRKHGVEIPDEPNNYGMKFIKRPKD